MLLGFGSYLIFLLLLCLFINDGCLLLRECNGLSHPRVLGCSPNYGWHYSRSIRFLIRHILVRLDIFGLFIKNSYWLFIGFHLFYCSVILSMFIDDWLTKWVDWWTTIESSRCSCVFQRSWSDLKNEGNPIIG